MNHSRNQRKTLDLVEFEVVPNGRSYNNVSMNYATPLKQVLHNLSPLSPSVSSPLFNLTEQHLLVFQPSPSPTATSSTTTATFESNTTERVHLDIDKERQHLQDPLCGYTPFFTAERETLDLQEINGNWLDKKEKSQQARLVLAEKRMLRRLTSRFS